MCKCAIFSRDIGKMLCPPSWHRPVVKSLAKSQSKRRMWPTCLLSRAVVQVLVPGAVPRAVLLVDRSSTTCTRSRATRTRRSTWWIARQDPRATLRAATCAPQPGSARCVARPNQDPHAALRAPTRIRRLRCKDPRATLRAPTRIRALLCAPQPGSARWRARPNQDPHAAWRAAKPGCRRKTREPRNGPQRRATPLQTDSPIRRCTQTHATNAQSCGTQNAKIRTSPQPDRSLYYRRFDSY